MDSVIWIEIILLMAFLNGARGARAINDRIESNKAAEDAIVDRDLEGPGPDQKV